MLWNQLPEFVKDYTQGRTDDNLRDTQVVGRRELVVVKDFKLERPATTLASCMRTRDCILAVTHNACTN